MATQFDAVRSKVFNFHRIRSVLIAKLRTKSSQKTEMHKLDTGNKGNLMPIKIYESLFLQTNLAELNKSINKKIVLHTCSYSCIPQVGICHIAVIN